MSQNGQAEPASDRTSVRRVEGGFRLRSPDGTEVTITAWMLSDLLHDERTRTAARIELWRSPMPFRLVDSWEANGHE